jgi:hypothetical protein
MVPTRLMPMEVMVCSARFGSECWVLEFVPAVYSKSFFCDNLQPMVAGGSILHT